MFEELPTWVKAICYAAFSAFGGTMGYVMRSIDAKEKISYIRATMEGLAAGFVGLLVLMVCQATELSEPWTGVIVGVSGWLGANVTIRLLEKLIHQKLGVTKSNPEDDNANNAQ